MWESTNSQPNYIARVLPNGETHYIHREYNHLGQPIMIGNTYSTPSGVVERSNTLTYAANGVDLLSRTDYSGAVAHTYRYNTNHQVIAETNAVGDWTTYSYDSTGRLTGTTRSTGLTTTNRYDANGWLTNTTDVEIGRSQSFTWTNGQICAHTDANGLTTTNVWDALRRLTRVLYPGGSNVWYAYTNLDLACVTNRLGGVTKYTYDAGRRLTSVTDPNTNTTSYSYCTCGSLDSITDAEQQVTTFYYDLQGRMTNVVYPDGYQINRRYNLIGQLTNETDSAGVSVTTWYNNQGLLVAVSNVFGRVQSLTFDIEDHVTQSTDANGVTTTNAYDALGRLIARGYSATNSLETFAYSARGLIGHTNALGYTNLFGYDAASRKTAETNANGEVTHFKYDSAGNLTNLIDGKSQNTFWRYDEYARVARKMDHLGTNLFLYTYDAGGRLTHRWTPGTNATYGINTRYNYDRVGNLTSVDYTNSADLTLKYDRLSRLTNMLDGVGATRYTYTAAGLLASEDGPWESDTVSLTYTNRLRSALSLQQPNAAAWAHTYGYDGARRLTTLTSPAGTFSYQYWSAGILPASVTLPSGAYVTNLHDPLARLTGTYLKHSSHTNLNLHEYTYNATHQRTKQTRFDASFVDYGYDGIGQLRSGLGKESGGTTNRLHEQLGYVYDAAGNLNYRTNNALVQSFSVNTLNELTSVGRSTTNFTVAGVVQGTATSVTVNGAAASLYGDQTFAKANVAIVDGTNTFTAVATDSLSRWDTNTVTAWLPATVSYVYDLNGNLLTDGRRHFRYDNENQLTQVILTNQTRSDFLYDGKMRRRVWAEAVWQNGVWATNLLVRYVYDGNVVLQERYYYPQLSASVAQQTVTYTRGKDLGGSLEGAGGIGGLLARSQSEISNPQFVSHAYYHADGNGNVTALIGTNQTAVARYLYDSFGNLLASSGPLAEANLYRFSSKEWHAASGLVYYGYRFYDPSLQRWLNADPLGERSDLNLFKALINTPIDAIDPDGEFAAIIGVVVAVGLILYLDYEGIVPHKEPELLCIEWNGPPSPQAELLDILENLYPPLHLPSIPGSSPGTIYVPGGVEVGHGEHEHGHEIELPPAPPQVRCPVRRPPRMCRPPNVPPRTPPREIWPYRGGPSRGGRVGVDPDREHLSPDRENDGTRAQLLSRAIASEAMQDFREQFHG